MSNLIPLIPPPAAKANKVLVIAHRIELITQAKAQISKFNPKLVRMQCYIMMYLGTDDIALGGGNRAGYQLL